MCVWLNNKWTKYVSFKQIALIKKEDLILITNKNIIFQDPGFKAGKED